MEITDPTSVFVEKMNELCAVTVDILFACEDSREMKT